MAFSRNEMIRMDFFNVLSVAEVQKMVREMAFTYTIETENIKLLDALGRVVARDILSDVDLPRFNRSTVDGYAVVCQDVLGASSSIPSFLIDSGEVVMGEETDLTLQKGQAIYVPTGGMVPNGAEGMVMIEYVEKLDDQTLLVYKPIAPGENMSFIGDDLKQGEIIVQKGKKITPFDIGLLAGMGIYEIEVFKKPRFSVLSTGDEIIDLKEEMSIGKVRDINGYALSAMITHLGGEVIHKNIIQDDFDKLRHALDKALQDSDIVLISGGSSVGMRDYTKKLIESYENGRVLVHGISIKPGKPTIVGQINGKVVFGLPGHPVSALVVFNQVVESYIKTLLSKIEKEFFIKATLTNNVHGAPGRDTFQMVRLITKSGEWFAEPIHGKSGMMTLLTKSSGYIKISKDKEGFKKDEVVEVFLLEEVEL